MHERYFESTNSSLLSDSLNHNSKKRDVQFNSDRYLQSNGNDPRHSSHPVCSPEAPLELDEKVQNTATNITTIASVSQPDIQDIGAGFANFGPFNPIAPGLGSGNYTSSLDMSSSTLTLDNRFELISTRRIPHVENFDTLPSSSVSPYIGKMSGTRSETTMPIEAICYAFNRVGFDKDDSGALDVFPEYVGTRPHVESSSSGNVLGSPPSGDSAVAQFESWMEYIDYQACASMTSSV